MTQQDRADREPVAGGRHRPASHCKASPVSMGREGKLGAAFPSPLRSPVLGLSVALGLGGQAG